MQHLRSPLAALCLLLSGCSAGDAPGTPMIPSGEQPASNDQQPPANAEAPLPGPQLLPTCSDNTTPQEFLAILTDVVCTEVAICRCTRDVACDGCSTCYDRCRCRGDNNAVCREQCPEDQGQVSFDWGPTCQAFRDCAAGEGCEDLTVIANPLAVCPSELRACFAAAVSAVGCHATDTTAEDLSLAQTPACARIAELLDQATARASQPDAGTDLPNAG